MRSTITNEIVGAGSVAVVDATVGRNRLTRRGVLKLGFWTSLGALIVAAGAGVLNSLYPRGISGFGGPVVVKANAIPQPGAAPKQNIEGHFLLVNLEPNEGRIASDRAATDGGLLALWWKCPHLGCTVPWKEGEPIAPDKDPLERRGWFHCPCHGSTYTKAGVRVAGPAPRSMDTMQLSVAANGDITVQTGKVRSGGTDNPRRALPWTPPA
jgi:cytochrome b6-f complex iron-sulfur subunit